MKKWTGCFLIMGLIGCFWVLPAHAVEFWDGKVKAVGFLSQGWQSLEADAGARPGAQDTSSGFHRIRATIALSLNISENISGYLELSEEPNDFEGTEFGQISNDLAFINIKLLPWLSFKTGNIVTTLHNYIPYSDGAVVQGNPLIGNSPIDFITAEEGVQLVGNHTIGNGFVKKIGWDIALTNPRFFEGFDADNPYQYFGKLRFTFGGGFSMGGGLFIADGADQFVSTGGNGVPAVGGGATSAIFIGDGDPYNFPGTPTNSNETHSGLIPGIDVTLWQIDAQWVVPNVPLVLRFWGGVASDDWRYVNASGALTTLSNATDVIEEESEQEYYGFEAKYDFTSQIYVAARYSYTENTSSGVSGNTDLDRIQVAGGYWFNDVTLLKLEWVSQSEDAQSPGQMGGDWDGVVAELSVKF